MIIDSMRIAFAYDSAYPWFNGGIEKRRFLIMRALSEAGHQVHNFTMFREGMPGEEFKYKGIHYHCVGRAVPASAMYKKGRRNIVWPLKYAALLYFKLWSYRFDVIDADAFPFLHIPKLAFYAWATGAKFVVTWIEIWDLDYWLSYLGPLGAFGYAMEKLSMLMSDVKVSISELTKERMVKQLGAERDDVIVFPAAISKMEMERFIKKHKFKKLNKFIAVGRLVPQKRIDMAIRAVSGTDASLTVVGSGPEKHRLMELAKDLGIEKRVRFVDRIDSEEGLMKELCEARALLMFSEREGLSVISIESLVLGTPVIITKSSELTKEIRRYCHTIDEKRLGASLANLLKNRRSVLYNAKIPKSVIIREFSAERSVAIYTKLAR